MLFEREGADDTGVFLGGGAYFNQTQVSVPVQYFCQLLCSQAVELIGVNCMQFIPGGVTPMLAATGV